MAAEVLRLHYMGQFYGKPDPVLGVFFPSLPLPNVQAQQEGDVELQRQLLSKE